MSGRGGAGRNQGRKPIISDPFEWMLRVGQRCEDIQKTEPDDKALANYEDRHDVRVLRDAQQLVMEGAVG